MLMFGVSRKIFGGKGWQTFKFNGLTGGKFGLGFKSLLIMRLSQLWGAFPGQTFWAGTGFRSVDMELINFGTPPIFLEFYENSAASRPLNRSL